MGDFKLDPDSATVDFQSARLKWQRVKVMPIVPKTNIPLVESYADAIDLLFDMVVNPKPLSPLPVNMWRVDVVGPGNAPGEDRILASWYQDLEFSPPPNFLNMELLLIPGIDGTPPTPEEYYEACKGYWPQSICKAEHFPPIWDPGQPEDPANYLH